MTSNLFGIAFIRSGESYRLILVRSRLALMLQQIQEHNPVQIELMGKYLVASPWIVRHAKGAWSLGKWEVLDYREFKEVDDYFKRVEYDCLHYDLSTPLPKALLKLGVPEG